MITFQRHSQIVLEYLEKHNEKPDSIRLHQTCYSQISVFLKERSILYSHENALEWLREQSGPRALMGIFATAVARINDVYQSGHVRFQHRVRKKLCPAFESIVEEYHRAFPQTLFRCGQDERVAGGRSFLQPDAPLPEQVPRAQRHHGVPLLLPPEREGQHPHTKERPYVRPGDPGGGKVWALKRLCCGNSSFHGRQISWICIWWASATGV